MQAASNTDSTSYCYFIYKNEEEGHITLVKLQSDTTLLLQEEIVTFSEKVYQGLFIGALVPDVCYSEMTHFACFTKCEK